MSGRYKSGIRYRNIKNAVDEFIEYKKRWGITRIYFLDDELLTVESKLNELCKEMKRSGLVWACLGRSDRITAKKIEMMKDAGCVGIVFGIESFSDRVLEGIGKRNTAIQNYNALILCAKRGLKVRAQMMVGCLPYESWKDIYTNASVIRKVLKQTNGNVKFSFHIYQPLPGTAAYEEAMKDDSHWKIDRLKDFDGFQTVGDFQKDKSKRPKIAHKNSRIVFSWYDFLVSIAGKAEISYEAN
jgi:radical SAM superfamily enzyme YgiQ (UPF0313 family)